MPERPRTFKVHLAHRPREFRPRAGKTTDRGYGWDWQQLQQAFLDSNPLCAECDRQGRVTAATEVDHVVPFSGRDDALRLDWRNLQALCGACHRAKTSSQGVGKIPGRSGA